MGKNFKLIRANPILQVLVLQKAERRRNKNYENQNTMIWWHGDDDRDGCIHSVRCEEEEEACGHCEN